MKAPSHPRWRWLAVQLARLFADNIDPSAPGLANVVIGGTASLRDAPQMFVD
jgi:hypothetical protein